MLWSDLKELLIKQSLRQTLCLICKSLDKGQLILTRRSTDVAPKCALRIFLLEEVLFGLIFTMVDEEKFRNIMY